MFGEEVEQEANEEGEEFALKLETGTKNNLSVVNTTRIYPDRDTTNSKHYANFNVPKNWFSAGTYYTITAIHATKIRGLPPGDGGGKVYFMKKPGDEFWGTFFSWAVEAEDFDGFEAAKQGFTKNCNRASDQEICQTVVRNGYPKR